MLQSLELFGRDLSPNTECIPSTFKVHVAGVENASDLIVEVQVVICRKDVSAETHHKNADTERTVTVGTETGRVVIEIGIGKSGQREFFLISSVLSSITTIFNITVN